MIVILLYELLFLPFVYFSWRRETYFFLEQFEYFNQFDTTIVFIVFLLLLLFYTMLFFLPSKTLLFSWGKFLIWMLPLVLILALTPPILSTDTGSYLIYAKSFFTYGQNPYVISLSTFSANPWVAEFSPHWWTEFTSPYGPLFTLLLAPIIFLAGKSLLASVLIYKILLVGVYIGCIALCQRIVRQQHLPESTTALFALNPAILIHGILEGHNDLLILFSLLLAVYFFNQKWIKSFIFLSLGIAIKFIPGVLLPVYIAHGGKIYWKRILPIFGILLGIFLLAFLPFEYPLKEFFKNLTLQSKLDCFYGCSPFIRFTQWIWPQVHSQFYLFLSFCLFLLVWYFFAWKSLKILEYLFWSLFILLFFLSPAFTPWYSLSLVGVGVLLSSRLHYRILTVSILFYTFIHYFGV